MAVVGLKFNPCSVHAVGKQRRELNSNTINKLGTIAKVENGNGTATKH